MTLRVCREVTRVMVFARKQGMSLLLIAMLIAGASGEVNAEDSFRLFPSSRFFTGLDWGYYYVSGEFLVPAGGRPGSGSKIDAYSDLGISQTEAVTLTLDGTVFDDHFFNLEYTMFMPSGLRRITRDFLFHNRLYSTGTLIDSKIDFNWLRLFYCYRVYEDGALRISPGFGLNHVRFGATLNSATEEGDFLSNSRRLDITYPTLGVETRFLAPHGLDFRWQFEAMSLITRGFVTLLKASANWEIYPDINISFSVSNRMTQSVEDNQELNNEWMFSFTGLSAGIAFGF